MRSLVKVVSKILKQGGHWKIVGGLPSLLSGMFAKGGFNLRYYIYRYRFKMYPILQKVSDFPTDVMVESTSQCNLKCIMCYHSDPDLPFQKSGKAQYMDIELFKKIVDECVDRGVYSMKLSFRGEPFMNKNFISMVQYAKSKNILELSSLTNATLMTEEKSKALLEAGLDQLVISMDGLTKETYELIRVKSNYDVMMENVKKLLDLRGKKSKPFIRIQYTEQVENRHETEAFYNYWKDKVDEVSISYYLEFDSVEKAKLNNKVIPVYDGFACEQLWQRLVVLSDGRVTLCGTDIMPHVVVGNVNEQSLYDVWNSKKMKSIRKLHQDGDYSKMPMCKVCVHNQHESDLFQENTQFNTNFHESKAKFL